MRRRLFTIILVILIIPAGTVGQSIYSSLGVGEVVLPSTARSAGLGLYGIGLQDQRAISLANPALWHQAKFAGIATGINSNMNRTSLGGQYSTFAFRGFNFHLPLANSVGAAIGFSPYSQIEYEFLREDNVRVLSQVSDTVTYTLESRGSGGVGGNYIGVGWKIFDRVSIGAAISFLLGQVDTDQNLRIDSPDNLLDREIAQTAGISGENLVLGGAFSGLILASDYLGVRAEIPLRLKVRTSETVYNGISLPEERETAYYDYLWPYQYALSYNVSLQERWMIAAEGVTWMPETELPSLTAVKGEYQYRTGMQLGVGMEYRLNPGSYVWWEKLALRTGVNWRKFMIANRTGEQPFQWKWSGGVGYPFGRGNRIDLAISYSHRTGFQAEDPVEDQLGFQVGVVLNELWFNGGIRNK